MHHYAELDGNEFVVYEREDRDGTVAEERVGSIPESCLDDVIPELVDDRKVADIHVLVEGFPVLEEEIRGGRGAGEFSIDVNEQVTIQVLIDPVEAPKR